MSGRGRGNGGYRPRGRGGRGGQGRPAGVIPASVIRPTQVCALIDRFTFNTCIDLTSLVAIFGCVTSPAGCADSFDQRQLGPAVCGNVTQAHILMY